MAGGLMRRDDPPRAFYVRPVRGGWIVARVDTDAPASFTYRARRLAMAECERRNSHRQRLERGTRTGDAA